MDKLIRLSRDERRDIEGLRRELLRRGLYRDLVRLDPPIRSRSAVAREIADRVLQPGDMPRDPSIYPAECVCENGALSRFGYLLYVSEIDRAAQAAYRYQGLLSRVVSPLGTYDRQSRWTPCEAWDCSGVHHVRSPSKRWPYSLLVHCCTLKHVAWVYSVPTRLVRVALQRLSDQATTVKITITGDRL